MLEPVGSITGANLVRGFEVCGPVLGISYIFVLRVAESIHGLFAFAAVAEQFAPHEAERRLG